jgi:hypothetical protein
VVIEPLDFLARLAALVPSPGVNLTRFHGVFAPPTMGCADASCRGGRSRPPVIVPCSALVRPR